MSASYIVDECCPRCFVDALSSTGHDVAYVVDRWPGAPDADLADIAMDIEAIIITQDYDFGELVIRNAVQATGVVIVACPDLTVDARATRLSRVVDQLSDRLAGYVTIVEPRRISA
jgi:predicted nuclease of predicted toxin-antitoxin system